MRPSYRTTDPAGRATPTLAAALLLGLAGVPGTVAAAATHAEATAQPVGVVAPAPDSPAAASPDPDPAGPPAAGRPLSSCGLAAPAAEALALLNAARARGATCGTRGPMAPAAALSWSGALQQAASRHSADMRDRDYVAHTSPEGRTTTDRALDAGYRWRTLAENIAAGQRSLTEVIADWLASDGHCANLMNAAMRDVALSCQGGGTGAYPTYWSLILGTPR